MDTITNVRPKLGRYPLHDITKGSYSANDAEALMFLLSASLCMAVSLFSFADDPILRKVDASRGWIVENCPIHPNWIACRDFIPPTPEPIPAPPQELLPVVIPDDACPRQPEFECHQRGLPDLQPLGPRSVEIVVQEEDADNNAEIVDREDADNNAEIVDREDADNNAEIVDREDADNNAEIVDREDADNNAEIVDREDADNNAEIVDREDADNNAEIVDREDADNNAEIVDREDADNNAEIVDREDAGIIIRIR